MVGDAVGDDTSETLHIIDFGCGKSYLTFVLYYYFYGDSERNVQIAGLDLKADVIKNCNAAAKSTAMRICILRWETLTDTARMRRWIWW